jgi:class 3 adenylate cyclase
MYRTLIVSAEVDGSTRAWCRIDGPREAPPSNIGFHASCRRAGRGATLTNDFCAEFSPVLYREPYERGALDVASRIPGAQAMRVSGDDYYGIFLSLDVVDEVERFLAGEEAPAVPDSVLATVMFADIVGSTERATALGDRAWRDLLARHHARIRRELGRFRGRERDTAGDGFFATFDGPARAIRAAQAIVGGVKELGLETRIGIHVGECELHEDKVAGLAVNIGARVAANAGANEILVSQTVRDLVAGSGIAFDDRGFHELKGIPGRWQLFAARC